MKQKTSSIVLVMCIALAQAAFPKIKWRTDFILQSGCLEEENLTLAELEDALERGEVRNGGRNAEMRCFLACLLEHSGYISDCQVNDEKFAGNEKMRFVRDKLVRCKEQVDAGERCDCAMQLAQCMITMRLN